MAAQGQFEENGIFYIQNDDDYKTVRVSFNNEHRYVGDIKIPSSVTHNDKTYKVSKIGRHAFRYCRNLKTVTIPNGVTVIEICAFAECDNLTTVTIPNSVKAIGDYAFYKCNSLSTIIIPNGVNSIGKYAFWGCNNLTAVTIPNSVKSIGDQAFYNCKKLASIEMPNSNVEIGDFAFPQGLISSSIIRGNNTDNVQQKNTQSLELEREGTANKKKVFSFNSSQDYYNYFTTSKRYKGRGPLFNGIIELKRNGSEVDVYVNGYFLSPLGLERQNQQCLFGDYARMFVFVEGRTYPLIIHLPDDGHSYDYIYFEPIKTSTSRNLANAFKIPISEGWLWVEPDVQNEKGTLIWHTDAVSKPSPIIYKIVGSN